MAKEAVLTPQGEDFPQWYQDVVARAELAETGPARGSMVIRPWAYAIWELMQADMDRRIKATGVQNAYFPLFIPMSFLEKEKQHVEGFSPELAVVTHGGGEQLAEPLVVRPTSETVINHLFAKWIQSHRDLPLLLNQWANVVRWELRPRLFLRTTEFLWQEGHTAHATYEDAQAETMLALEVYRAFMEDTLAVAVVTGEKSAAERFAGADRTYTLRGPDARRQGPPDGDQPQPRPQLRPRLRHPVPVGRGRARVRGHHLLGQLHPDARRGDHDPRRRPRPAPAPGHRPPPGGADPPGRGGGGHEVDKLAEQLRGDGIRTHVDPRFHLSFGRRSVDWELKGVPVRVELGPRELAAGQATLVRRDTRAKTPVPIDGVGRAARELLDELQRGLHAESLADREAHTYPVDDLGEFRERVGDGGFFRLAWCGSPACEAALGEGTGATIRVILDGPAPDGPCLVDGAAATHTVLVARAY